MALMSNRSRYAQTASDDSVPETADPPVGEHTHEQPRSPLVTALTVVVVALSLAVGWLGYNTYRLQQGQSETTTYLGDARDRRDTQNEELSERIDAAVCDVLDQLPAGGLFDPIREQYGCGPGIPVEQLDPTAAQNLADILGQIENARPAATTTAPPTSAPDEMPPGAPAGAQPSPVGTPPAPSPAPTSAPQPTPAPATTAPPLVDLTTVTDPVCALLGVCL